MAQSFVTTGTLTIKATVNTLLKIEPVQSSQLKDAEFYAFKDNEEFLISWYRRLNDHVKVSLKAPIRNRHDWFCYFDHVEAMEDGRVLDSFEDTPLITKYQAESVFGNTIRDAEIRDLNSCLEKFQVNTDARICHFLAQTAHESGGLKWMKELSNGRYLEGRKDLGNIFPGDGPKFKGAGAIQTSGRANFQALCDFLGDRNVIDIGCDYVAANLPFTSAGFWWYNNKVNAMIDAGATVREVTRRVNGGYNGLADRQAYYQRAKKVI